MTETDNLTPGQRLERHRLACGMTRQQLARKAGVSPSLITRLENGAQPMVHGDMLARLVKALDLFDPSDLTGDAPPVPPSAVLPTGTAAALRAAREAAGLSQRDLARLSGVSQSQISALEGGNPEHTADMLARLAAALNLPSLPATAAPPTSGTLLALAVLTPSGLNPRKTFDADELEGLADSIAARGLLQNLVVRAGDEPGRYLIVAGERRFRALTLLVERGQWDRDAATVPVRIVAGSDADHLALALLENLQRTNVNPMEEAEGFAQLLALDPDRWTTQSIADTLGCSRRLVQQRLSLVTRLCAEAQDALRQGSINFKYARALVAAPPTEQKTLLKERSRHPTAEALRDKITRGKVPVSRAIFPLDQYLGTFTETDTGARYFDGRDEFLALQKEAAKSKVEALRKTWGWAELKETHYVSPVGYELGSGPDAGCIVQFQPYDGIVTVHEGFVRVVGVVADEAERAAARAAEWAEGERREREADAFRAELARRMAADPGSALLLVLLDRLGRSDYGARCLTTNHCRGLPSALFAGGGPLETLAPLVEPYNALDRDRYLKSEKDEAAAWGVLRRLPGVNLRQAHEAYILARLFVSPRSPLHPALVDLARGYRLPVPSFLLPDGQADIEDAVNAAPSPEVPPGESVGCVVTCANEAVPVGLLAGLAAVLPAHPHYGRIGLSLVFDAGADPDDAPPAPGAERVFLLMGRKEPLVYEINGYDDGFSGGFVDLDHMTDAGPLVAFLNLYVKRCEEAASPARERAA